MREFASEHIKNLKSSLLKLKATGETGFEGLIGVALREITSAPFRLACSGFQRGIDGKAAFDEDSICFEGKLYKDSVPKTEVITKIADLTRNGINADLVWVLGATSQVPSQLADDVRADGKRSGVSVLILDWSETDIPPLPVALAIGGERVAKFLRTHLEPEYADGAIIALETIRRHNDFPSLEQRIRTSLDAPAMGSVFARKANIKWLTTAISDKARARDELGQPLAEAYKNAGRNHEGMTVIKKAFDHVMHTNEHWHDVELYRMKGDLLLGQSSDNQTKAETYFHQAFSIARQQQAKSWELRAAISLAHLW